MSVRVFGVLGLGLLTSACVTHVQRPTWARFGNTSTPDGGPAYHRDPHHQYYDKAHNRFYYYDPVLKRFFWENGQPKG